MSSTASPNLPLRQPSSRHHGHSVSVGSINQSHRVTRRKSLSSTNGTNVAAVAAALKDVPSAPFAVPSSNRKGLSLKSTGAFSKMNEASPNGKVNHLGNYPSPPSSFSNHLTPVDGAKNPDSAIVDSPNPSTASEVTGGTSTKSRIRRASEGSHLMKGEGKRVSGGDLRCDKCGKGYKHSSCLTKHLWEHTPEWSYTSKLLISKHQQVQLLEAASVLVAMNNDLDTPPDSAKDLGSDNSSASPSASGSSGVRGDMSSTDTTPPPQAEEPLTAPVPARAPRNERSKRHSGNSSSYSRSYQSAPSTSVLASSAPLGTADFRHLRSPSGEGQPASSSTAPITTKDEEEASLAAAVELLSCSFGTPRSGPVTLPPDVPPVPPLPARFLGHNNSNLSGSTATPTGQRLTGEMGPMYSHTHLPRDREMKMDDSEESAAEEEYYDRRSSRGRSDEEDDGVFGRMEE